MENEFALQASAFIRCLAHVFTAASVATASDTRWHLRESFQRKTKRKALVQSLPAFKDRWLTTNFSSQAGPLQPPPPPPPTPYPHPAPPTPLPTLPFTHTHAETSGDQIDLSNSPKGLSAEVFLSVALLLVVWNSLPSVCLSFLGPAYRTGHPAASL